MSIGYLYSRYPVVSQTFCDSEMLALEAGGLELWVVSLNAPPSSFRHERLRDLRAEIVYPPPSEVLKKQAIPPAMAALAAEHTVRYGASFKAGIRARNAAWVAPVLARRGVTHIHVHFANRATHTALFLKKAGFSFSFTAHAQDYQVDLGSHELLRELAREAEFVIAVSDFSRDELRGLCPESAGKIHRLYNGLTPADFPAAGPGSDGPLRIVSVGRLIEFKGFHHLIEAVAGLGDQGVAARLDIIGDGPWQARLQRQIDDAGAADRIRLRGPLSQDQIKAELAASDVFALACCIDEKGASDILPTVIMEAMAVGLPVVSTRVAGVPEMVDDGHTGLLVDPAHPAAFSAALARLARDPKARRSMGQAGRDRAVEKFSIDRARRDLAGRFQAAAAAGAPAVREACRFPVVLCLTAGATEPELASLAADPWVGGLAATGTDGAPWLEFLPDAMVLEGSWRNAGADAARCEALYTEVRPVDGESFLLAARRAVHTAALVRRRGIRHLHACRSTALVWTWLVKKLTGLRASFAIEDHPSVSRSLLARLIGDFEFGSIGDARLSELTGGRFPEALGLAPPPRKGLFAPTAGPPPDPAAWRARLLDGLDP